MNYFVGYPSTPPRNLSLLSSNSTEEGTLTINLTWIPPEYSHGNIEYYSVEFYYNDTDMPVKVEKRTEVRFLYHVQNLCISTNIKHFLEGIKCVLP